MRLQVQYYINMNNENIKKTRAEARRLIVIMLGLIFILHQSAKQNGTTVTTLSIFSNPTSCQHRVHFLSLHHDLCTTTMSWKWRRGLGFRTIWVSVRRALGFRTVWVSEFLSGNELETWGGARFLQHRRAWTFVRNQLQNPSTTWKMSTYGR